MAVVINGNNGISYDDTGIQYYGTGNDLAIYHDGSNSYITNSTGAVIIDGSNPQLKITGDYQTRISLGTAYTDKPHWSITNEANANRLRIGVADDDNDTNFISTMVITDGGNVGIGTSSPTSKLTVNGNQSFTEKTDAYIGVDVATSSGDGGDLTIKAGSGSGSGNVSGNLLLAAGRGSSSASNGYIAFGISNSSNVVGLDAERMRIDTSGNLLVGTITASPSNTDGCVFYPQGTALFTRASDYVLYLNRRTTDGEIVRFNKDGTTTGRIGTDGTNIYIGGAVKALKLQSTNFIPRDIDDTNADNTVDLGATTSRFKDLYLSGGVSIAGGSSIANVINEGGNNTDFRVESVNQQHMFYVDASTDTVGIQTSSPHLDYQLDVNGISHAQAWQASSVVTGSINVNGSWSDKWILLKNITNQINPLIMEGYFIGTSYTHGSWGRIKIYKAYNTSTVTASFTEQTKIGGAEHRVQTLTYDGDTWVAIKMDYQNVSHWSFTGICFGTTERFGQQTVVYSGVTNETDIATT